jgi:hypothetical protein
MSMFGEVGPLTWEEWKFILGAGFQVNCPIVEGICVSGALGSAAFLAWYFRRGRRRHGRCPAGSADRNQASTRASSSACTPL